MSSVLEIGLGRELLATYPYVSIDDEDERNSADDLAQDIARMLLEIGEHIAIPLTFQEARPDARFRELAQEWHAEASHLSSVTAKATHPAYQQVIGMGKEALPLILADLRRAPKHWFWALRAITGIDPVRLEDRGRIAAMTESWLSWGREQGLLQDDEP